MIRLAFNHGLLTQKSHNKWQRFAAQYQIRMARRIEIQDIEDTLQRQTWYLDPARYDELFLAGEIVAPPTFKDETFEEEEVVQDVDEVDEYFARLDEQRTMTGAEAFAVIDDETGWL